MIRAFGTSIAASVGGVWAPALSDLAERLPNRRIGTPDDIAQAFMSVMSNGFITATVLHVDGDHRLT